MVLEFAVPMRHRTKILFCDDLQSERKAFLRHVATRLHDSVSCQVAASHDGVKRLIGEQENFDILLTDLNFDHIGGGTKEGLQILKTAKDAWPDLEVVIFTAYPNSLLPEEVLDASARGLSLDTWVTKISDDPADSWDRLYEVIRALLKAIAERRLREEYEDISLSDAIRYWAGRQVHELTGEDRFTQFPQLVGRGVRMRRLYEQIRRVAVTETSVLIYGEPGTGKELVARALHSLSGRAKGPFLAVNCGEFSEALLASELFGHRKGAFTGAVSNRQGLFEAASGGTFFLDEIGEMSPENQATFLRVLEDGEVRPLGATKNQPVDVRVVAATNRDLSELKTTGEFRNDLLARLNRYFIYVPPLRARRTDIPVLAVHTLHRLREQYGREVSSFDEVALWLLASHTWPGNMRELESTLARSLIDMSADEAALCASAIALQSEPVEQEGAHDLFQRIMGGEVQLPLSKIAKRFGLPRTKQVVEQVMRHFEGLPPDKESRRLFQMSYRNWQHWAHYHGLTWEKVRQR